MVSNNREGLRMRESPWVFPLAFGLLLPGCAGSFQYKPRTMSGTKWEASTVSVVVDDKRLAVSPTLPRVPVVTLGGGQQNDLRLPPEFAEFVEWRLSQIVTRRGRRVRLLIIPEEVRAGWSATAWSETEKATVSLRFRITNEDGSRVLVEGLGHGQKEFSSADASDQELAQVFRAACNDAFDAFFASAANVQRLNAAAAESTSSGTAPEGLVQASTAAAPTR
jgi:hypothetical protein